jgi:hypothetical protein
MLSDSEASEVTNRAVWPTWMLRCAQHDTRESLFYDIASYCTLTIVMSKISVALPGMVGG